MDHKYIYLVFSKTGTWLSNIINIFSDTKFVHSSISFDDSFTEMYSFGRTNPNNPFSGGFVKESLHEGVYKKFKRSECMIYRVKVTEKQYYSLRKNVEEFLKKKDKYRYNFIGLFGVLLDKPIKRKNHYFCSQFVSEILIKNKVYNSNKPSELIQANDLFSIKNKEIIYEGYINKCYLFNDAYIFNKNLAVDFH
ncbi:hypothetical protein [Brassicibacter mesophilus]|uniref:hypothetical protein n=1 Tax=Brassicibacter mesophilus TaxID=745119 RepID=UPI003D1C579C